MDSLVHKIMIKMESAVICTDFTLGRLLYRTSQVHVPVD